MKALLPMAQHGIKASRPSYMQQKQTRGKLMSRCTQMARSCHFVECRRMLQEYYLAGDNGLHEESEHGEHSQTAVLDLLDLRARTTPLSICIPLFTTQNYSTDTDLCAFSRATACTAV
jgi:hypothetical protein